MRSPFEQYFRELVAREIRKVRRGGWPIKAQRAVLVTLKEEFHL